MVKDELFPKGREHYPTKEVDPINFLEDNDIKQMVENIDDINFKKEDFLKLYNCVDCAECDTEEERILLKQKYLEKGYTFNGWEEMQQCFKDYRTPYPTNEMRMKIPEEVPKESDTLFFMGCLSTIRIPKYTEHSIDYLLSQNIDFTILDKEICCGWPFYVSGSNKELEIAINENIKIFQNYKKIICLCPACYELFRKEYTERMENPIRVEFIIDYLKPSKEKKTGTVAFQHLCQLMNRGREGSNILVEDIFRKSGYEIIDVPHWCCGHGLGRMHRLDVIDKIGEKRIKDFDREDIDYATTYCVSCWWWLDRFGKKFHIKPQIKDVFELLM
ncbi:MAG: (Fe-S)-binding protein [Candidatus Lokiarchaeota archaeon]